MSKRSKVTPRARRSARVAARFSTSNAIWVDSPDGAPAELKRWNSVGPHQVAQAAGALLDWLEPELVPVEGARRDASPTGGPRRYHPVSGRPASSRPR